MIRTIKIVTLLVVALSLGYNLTAMKRAKSEYDDDCQQAPTKKATVQTNALIDEMRNINRVCTSAVTDKMDGYCQDPDPTWESNPEVIKDIADAGLSIYEPTKMFLNLIQDFQDELKDKILKLFNKDIFSKDSDGFYEFDEAYDAFVAFTKLCARNLETLQDLITTAKPDIIDQLIAEVMPEIDKACTEAAFSKYEHYCQEYSGTSCNWSGELDIIQGVINAGLAAYKPTPRLMELVKKLSDGQQNKVLMIFKINLCEKDADGFYPFSDVDDVVPALKEFCKHNLQSLKECKGKVEQ